MPIRVVVLDEKQRCDQGVSEIPGFDPGKNPFDKKGLEATSFSDPNCSSSIGAEKYDDVQTFQLGSGRLNDRERAFFVKLSTSRGNEYLIVVGYLHDHNHDRYALLQSPETQAKILMAVQSKIKEIEAKEATQASSSAAASSESPKRRKAFGPHQLSETQRGVLNRLAHSGVVLWGAAGSGKTLLTVDWFRQLQATGLHMRYLAPSDALCQVVSEAVGPDTQIMTPRQLDNYLCDQLPDILERETRIPADYVVFEEWFRSTYLVASPKFNQTHADISKMNPRLVYDAIIHSIIQPVGKTLRTLRPCLSRTEFPTDLIYTVFEAYRAYLVESKKYFEPHLRQFGVFQALLRCDDPNLLEAVSVDKLAIDELQRMHPWLLYTAFLLLKDHKSGQHYFFDGDPYQDLSLHNTRATQQYQTMMRHFSVAHIENPVVLTESFRSGRLVGLLANRLLCMYEDYCGSHCRAETFGFIPHDSVHEGDLKCVTYHADFFESCKNDAETFVLIPNGFSMETAKRQWPGMSVFYVADVVGLEKRRVILCGFSEYYAQELNALKSILLPELAASPVFSRKVKKGTQGEHSERVHTAITEIYSGVSRSFDEVVIVDDKLHPCFTHLIADIVTLKTQSATAVTEAVHSTPQQWLETAKNYLRQENRTVQQAGLEILFSDKVWGPHAALAKEWLTARKLSINHTKLCVNVIDEIQRIVSAQDVTQTLGALIGPQREAVSVNVGVVRSAAAAAAPEASPSTCLAQLSTATVVDQKRNAKITTRLRKICEAQNSYFPHQIELPTLNTSQLNQLETQIERALTDLESLGLQCPTMKYRYAEILLIKQLRANNDDLQSMSFDIFRDLAVVNTKSETTIFQFPGDCNNVILSALSNCRLGIFLRRAHQDSEAIQHFSACVKLCSDEETRKHLGAMAWGFWHLVLWEIIKINREAKNYELVLENINALMKVHVRKHLEKKDNMRQLTWRDIYMEENPKSFLEVENLRIICLIKLNKFQEALIVCDDFKKMVTDYYARTPLLYSANVTKVLLSWQIITLRYQVVCYSKLGQANRVPAIYGEVSSIVSSCEIDAIGKLQHLIDECGSTEVFEAISLFKGEALQSILQSVLKLCEQVDHSIKTIVTQQYINAAGVANALNLLKTDCLFLKISCHLLMKHDPVLTDYLEQWILFCKKIIDAHPNSIEKFSDKVIEFFMRYVIGSFSGSPDVLECTRFIDRKVEKNTLIDFHRARYNHLRSSKSMKKELIAFDDLMIKKLAKAQAQTPVAAYIEVFKSLNADEQKTISEIFPDFDWNRVSSTSPHALSSGPNMFASSSAAASAPVAVATAAGLGKA